MKMKRIWRLWILLICLVVALSACGSKRPNPPTWQERYDLGVRYLSEGNYQEAIIAFTAAIEIDPKQAPAYVGRGDSYIGLGETEDNLASARADYEQAIALDGSGVDVYIKLADLYLLQDEYGEALKILQQGLDTVGENQELADKLLELKNAPPLNDYGSTEWIYRWYYIDFDSMTRDQQTVVEMAAAAAMGGDYDAVLQIYNLISDAGLWQGFNDEGTPYCYEYSIWNGYKIKFQISTWQNKNTGMLDFDSLIEMRPENGTGYSISYWYESGRAVDGHHTMCPCVDWQWNGTMHSTGFNLFSDSLNEETGIMINSLRDGTFSKTNTYPKDHVVLSDSHTYQNGKLLDSSDEEPTFSTINRNFQGTLNDPWLLEAIYW